jgi:hypothetical protein
MEQRRDHRKVVCDAVEEQLCGRLKVFARRNIGSTAYRVREAASTFSENINSKHPWENKWKVPEKLIHAFLKSTV